MRPSSLLVILCLALVLDACGGSASSSPPVGTSDAGARSDGGMPPADGGHDAGAGPESDAGPTPDTPRVPTFSGTEPLSPHSNPEPRIMGTAEPHVTVELYTDLSCRNTPAAAQATDDEGHFAIRVAVPANTRTLYASAAVRDGVRSPCSTDFIGYTHDDVAPTVSSTTPASGAVDVALTSAPTAQFSEFVSASTVRLDVTCGGLSVTGTLEVRPGRVTFTPGGALPEQSSCEATVQAVDEAGNALPTPHTWRFTTRSGSAPQAGPDGPESRRPR